MLWELIMTWVDMLSWSFRLPRKFRVQQKKNMVFQLNDSTTHGSVELLVVRLPGTTESERDCYFKGAKKESQTTGTQNQQLIIIAEIQNKQHTFGIQNQTPRNRIMTGRMVPFKRVLFFVFVP